MKKAYLVLHISVFILGFTGIFGRLIELSEISIVWWRLLFTCLSLLLVPKLITILRKITRQQFWQMLAVGCIIATHWVFFYGSIKYSNVSVGLSVFATTSFFTALVEPMILGRKVRAYELLLGLLVIPGVYLIFRFTSMDYTLGILMGLFSAFLSAVFTSWNKRIVSNANPLAITFVELGGGLVFITILMPVYWMVFGTGQEKSIFWPVDWQMWLYLGILAVVCTTLAHVWVLRVLRQISAFSVNLSLNLEPIYGIILAWIIFGENRELDWGFYVGVGIILSAVFLYPWLRKRFQQ